MIYFVSCLLFTCVLRHESDGPPPLLRLPLLRLQVPEDKVNVRPGESLGGEAQEDKGQAGGRVQDGGGAAFKIKCFI